MNSFGFHPFIVPTESGLAWMGHLKEFRHIMSQTLEHSLPDLLAKLQLENSAQDLSLPKCLRAVSRVILQTLMTPSSIIYLHLQQQQEYSISNSLFDNARNWTYDFCKQSVHFATELWLLICSFSLSQGLISRGKLQLCGRVHVSHAQDFMFNSV